VRLSHARAVAHTTATQAASAARNTGGSLTASERQELQGEIACPRTFSDVRRTHLRAYLESLTRSIEDWERAERKGALAAKDSVLHPAR
jgi:hypothetical protein